MKVFVVLTFQTGSSERHVDSLFRTEVEAKSYVRANVSEFKKFLIVPSKLNKKVKL